MEEQRLRQILETIATREIPSNVDLWPIIQKRLVSSPGRRIGRPLRLRFRLGFTGVLLVWMLGLTLTLTVYAVSTLWGRMPFWQPVEEVKVNLGIPLHMTQTMNNFTVNLERAYADANQVLIGLTVTQRQARRPLMVVGTLTDAQGNTLPALLVSGLSGQPELLGLSLPSEAQANVLAFDASGIQEAQEELHLRLQLDLFTMDMDSAILEGNSEVKDDTIQPVCTVPTRPEVGPFVFEFTVPFHPGHHMKISQVSSNQGLPITLQEITLTPVAIRAILCYSPPMAEENVEWLPVATIQKDGRRWDVGNSSLVEQNCYRINFFAYDTLIPVDTPGEWVLVVNELIGVSPWSVNSLRITGPWIFRFHVP